MSGDDALVKEFKSELDEPPCYVCGSYFCTDYDYCDVARRSEP